jgi:orotate phosphoribosyltransferase
MDKGVKFVMNREEMKSLSAKQILIAKEKLEHGEHVLLVNEIFISPISFQNAMEIVRNIKEKVKLRELESQTPKL